MSLMDSATEPSPHARWRLMSGFVQLPAKGMNFDAVVVWTERQDNVIRLIGLSWQKRDLS